MDACKKKNNLVRSHGRNGVGTRWPFRLLAGVERKVGRGVAGRGPTRGRGDEIGKKTKEKRPKTQRKSNLNVSGNQKVGSAGEKTEHGGLGGPIRGGKQNRGDGLNGKVRRRKKEKKKSVGKGRNINGSCQGGRRLYGQVWRRKGDMMRSKKSGENFEAEEGAAEGEKEGRVLMTNCSKADFNRGAGKEKKI